MPVGFYMDVHVPQAVTDQLVRRNVDVLTAVEDKAAELDDEFLLDRSTTLGRIMVTFDVRFKALAEGWQRAGRPLAAWLTPIRSASRSANWSAIWN